MSKSCKRILSAIVIFTLIIPAIFAPRIDAYAETKGVLSFGSTQTGMITEENDLDQYTVVLPMAGKLTVRITSRLEWLTIEWQDYERQRIRFNDIGTGSEYSPKIYEESMDLEGGTYYLNVLMNAGRKGAYEITTQFVQAGNNESEPNDKPEQAQPISINQTVRGFISYQDDNDYYKIELQQAGRLTVHITSRLEWLNIEWLDNALQRMRNNDLGGGSESSPKIYEQYIDLEAGVYFIRIYKNAGRTGVYDVVARFDPAGNNETEPNNKPEQAQPLAFNQIVTGFISYQDDDDYYKVTLQRDDKLSVKVTSRLEWLNIEWLDGAYQRIQYNDLGGGSENSPKIYEHEKELTAGTYYIRIFKNAGRTGIYDLQLYTEASAGAPVLALSPSPIPSPMPSPSPIYSPVPSPDGDGTIASPAPAGRSEPDFGTDAPGAGAGNKPAPDLSGVVMSDWARVEVEKAGELGVIPDSLLTRGTNLTQPITREEFAAVSVKTYEALSGVNAIPAIYNPFTDCKNTEVLKAYNVGITVGTSATTFEPYELLNREQAATMLTRVFKRVAIPGWTFQTDGDYRLSYPNQQRFSDDSLISDWAVESVYFMVANKIIFGLGNNTFAPRNVTTAEEAQKYANATREQALIIAARMVENL